MSKTLKKSKQKKKLTLKQELQRSIKYVQKQILNHGTTPELEDTLESLQLRLEKLGVR